MVKMYSVQDKSIIVGSRVVTTMKSASAARSMCARLNDVAAQLEGEMSVASAVDLARNFVKELA
jgi:hypothetical protein